MGVGLEWWQIGDAAVLAECACRCGKNYFFIDIPNSHIFGSYDNISRMRTFPTIHFADLVKFARISTIQG